MIPDIDSPGCKTMPKQSYEGSCHCGGVNFEVDMDLDHVRVCDCSGCRMRGGLNHRVGADDIRLNTPLGALTLYQWNTRTARDYFCPTCGIQPFRRPRTAPALWTVNVRCLRDVDIDTIPIERVHGRDLS
jgi:hypothetical protein